MASPAQARGVPAGAPRAPRGGRMSDPAVQFDRVSRRFGKTLALDAVTLEVPRGTVLGLIGRNGAGKTTALRLALGRLWPDGGRIRTLGMDPVGRPREVAT